MHYGLCENSESIKLLRRHLQNKNNKACTEETEDVLCYRVFYKFENLSSSRDDFEAKLPSKVSTDMNKALTRSNLLFNWHGWSRSLWVARRKRG